MLFFLSSWILFDYRAWWKSVKSIHNYAIDAMHIPKFLKAVNSKKLQLSRFLGEQFNTFLLEFIRLSLHKAANWLLIGSSQKNIRFHIKIRLKWTFMVMMNFYFSSKTVKKNCLDSVVRKCWVFFSFCGFFSRWKQMAIPTANENLNNDK